MLKRWFAPDRRNIRLVVLAGAFFLLIFSVRADSLGLPAFWDEEGYLGLVHMASRFRFDGSEYQLLEAHHPGYYFFALGLLTKLIGWKLIWFRLAGFAACAAFLLASYLLARVWLDRFRASALVICIFSVPIVLSEAAIFGPDMPAAAALLWALYSMQLGSRRRASLLFACAAAINSPVLALAPVFFPYFERQPGRWKSIARFLLPAVLVVLIWIVIFFAVMALENGFAFREVFPARNLPGSVLAGGLARSLLFRIHQLFLNDGRIVFSVFLLSALGIRARVKSKLFSALLIAICVQLVVYTFLGVWHDRYFLIGISSLILAGGAVIHAWAQLSRERVLRFAGPAVAAVFLAFAFWEYQRWKNPHSPEGTWPPYYNRHLYVEQIRLIQRVADELRGLLSDDALVVTEWPLRRDFLVPEQGFVSAPLPGRYVNIAYTQNLETEVSAQLSRGLPLVVVIDEPSPFEFDPLRARNFRYLVSALPKASCHASSQSIPPGSGLSPWRVEICSIPRSEIL